VEKLGKISRNCDKRKCNPRLCRQGKTNIISIRHRMTLKVVREFGKKGENWERGEGNKEKDEK
jgi:hypothetical protein